MAETWRVVLATGEVREAFPEHNGVQWCTFVDGYHGWGRTPHASICAVVGLHGWPVAEILAPGEPTRAELAAQLAAVTQRAEFAEARDRLAQTLDAEDPALRAAADAEGSHAVRAAALAAARREGAEAMREAILDALPCVTAESDRCAAIAHTVPVPGDATGGDP